MDYPCSRLKVAATSSHRCTGKATPSTSVHSSIESDNTDDTQQRIFPDNEKAHAHKGEAALVETGSAGAWKREHGIY